MEDNTGMKVNVETKKSEKKTKLKKPPFNWKVIVVILIVVLSLSAAFYFWNDAQNAKSQTPEAVAAKNQEESKRVIQGLDAILLTESEDAPTVARIEDPAVLQKANEEFYKNAQAGDYLVLYPQRAIIYRESENRIINVAPIINSSQITPDENK